MVGLDMARDELEIFYASFEKSGEVEVRRRLAQHHYDERGVRLAENWLKELEEKRSSSIKEEEIRLVRESNAIARDANKIALEAKEASKFSNIIAIVAILFSLFALVVSLLKG
jgi:L-fucose isomerase-like protein